MAQTIGFGDLQDQQNQQNQNQQQSGQPTTTPGAGQAGSTGGASSSQAGPQAASGPQGGGSGAQNLNQYKPAAYSQQTQGSGYTNLQKLLQANNPSQLQNAVSSNIESQNQSALGNLNQSQQQFAQGTQANQANTAQNQQMIQQILANPTQFTNLNNASTGAQQAATGAGIQAPTAQNQAQGNLFSQLMGGQYQGPMALENQAQLSAQAQSAAQQAQNLTTAAGRQGVLQNLIQSPNYTTGQQSLDAALLGQGNPQGLTQARTQALGLQNMVGQAAAAANAQGQEQASNAQQFGAQTQNQFGQTVGNLNTQLQQQAAAAQGQRNTQYQQLLSDAAAGNFTQQEADLLGLTQGEEIGSDLLSTIGAGKETTENPLQATAQNVANQQQYATLDALRQLAGSSAPGAAQGILGKYSGQEAQAGAYNATPGMTANTSDIASQAQAASGAYDQANNYYGGPNGQVQLGLNFKNWSNGTLTDADRDRAKQLGFTDQQLSGGMGPAMAGQALWNDWLTRTYGANQTGGNSRGLTTDYGNWAYQNVYNQYQNVLKNLGQQYGSLQTVNIQPPADATQGALQSMANGTVINRNT